MLCNAARTLYVVSGIFLLLISSSCRPASTPANPSGPAPAADSTAQPGPDGSDQEALSSILKSSQGNDLIFTRTSIDQGLSKSIVWNILQDHQGFLWFATEDGLNRYDGVNFKVFKHDPDNPQSLSSNNITALIEDQDGLLWVGTNGGGIALFDPHLETYRFLQSDLNQPGTLSSNYVSTIYADWKGNIWVGTADGGLNQYDPSNGEFLNYAAEPSNPDSLSSNHIQAILLDRSSMLWVGTNHGLDRMDLKTEKSRHFKRNPANPYQLSGENISALQEAADGSVWVGSRDGGLDRYDPASQRFTRYPVNAPRTAKSSETGSVSALRISRSGLIWVGTQSAGLALLDPSTGTFRFYQSSAYDRSSIGSNQIEAVYEDRSGIIWVGTYGGGFSKLDWRSNQFTHYRRLPDDPNSLSGELVRAVLEDSHGILWVGTHEAGLNRVDRGSGYVIHFRHAPDQPTSLSSDTVLALYQDAQGYLWVGTDRGLNRINLASLENQRFLTDSSKIGSLGGSVVVGIGADRGQRMWVALNNGLIDRFDPQTQTFQHYRLADTGEVDPQVLTMLVEPSGAIWAGTLTGLVRLDPETGQKSYFPAKSKDLVGFSNSQVMALYRDRAGRLWVGTMGGLNLFDPQYGVLRCYRERDGLPNDYVYAILEDQQGDLWFSTDLGLSRFDPEQDTFTNFDVLDGLQSNEFSPGAGFQSSSGEMFFGGINGLTAFYPNRLLQNTHAPPVLVTSISQGGAPIRPDKDSLDGIVLKWPRNYFEFELSALNYSQPARNRYAYYLEGLDRDWLELGQQRSGRYTNLPGGTYTLHVRGSNNDGVWSENSAALRLKVVPPFWEWRWLQLVLAGGLILAAALGWRWRIQSIQQRSRELATLVEKRTQEIEKRRQVADELREVILRVNQNLPLQDSLGYIACQVGLLLQAESVYLFQAEAKGQTRFLAACSYDPALAKFTPGCGMPDGLARSLADGLRANPAPGPVPVGRLKTGLNAADSALLNHIGRVVIHPILLEGAVYGGLVALLGDTSHITPDEQELLAAFCEQAALAIGNDRLRAKAEELAIVSERNRLARDLHDAVTQTLFSASLIAETLPSVLKEDPREGLELLQELRQLTRGALAEMRTLLMELRPAVMVDAKLTDLLRQLVEAATGKKGIVVKFSAAEITPLPKEVHICLYRIAQEALTNVVKHSRAKNIGVALKEQPLDSGEPSRQVSLEICDDGRGFNLERIPPDHFGLVNMRERAQAAGARLEIISNPGEGTLIRAVWTGKDGRT